MKFSTAALMGLLFTNPAFAASVHCMAGYDDDNKIAELSLVPYAHGYKLELSVSDLFVTIPGQPAAPKGMYKITADMDERLIGCFLNQGNNLLLHCQKNDFLTLTTPGGAPQRIPAVIEFSLKEIETRDAVSTVADRQLDLRVSSPGFEVKDREIPMGRVDSHPGEIGGFCELR